MGRSLFRFLDKIELCILYVLCYFLNFLFNYLKTADLNSYILKAFLKNFLEHQSLIIFLFTFVVIVFHYQMLHRKKTEIKCRVLVGDTILNISILYIIDCFVILGFVFLLSLIVNVFLNINLASNLYLALIFVIYILISGIRVLKYENF